MTPPFDDDPIDRERLVYPPTVTPEEWARIIADYTQEKEEQEERIDIDFDEAELLDLDASPDEFAFTHEQQDAIHQTIKPYLKPDISWDRELCALTRVIGDIRTRAQVLYTGDIRRHLNAMETALEAFMQAYYQSPEPERFHLERQASDHLPSLDDETAPSVRNLIDALLKTVRQAQRRPFDAPYAYEQARGAPKKYAIVLLVTYLLSVFDRVTGGIVPTVYARSLLNSSTFAKTGQEGDTRTEYKGRALPFVVACVGPLKLVPRKQLNSAILAAYQQAKPGLLATETAWEEQRNALTNQGKIQKSKKSPS